MLVDRRLAVRAKLALEDDARPPSGSGGGMSRCPPPGLAGSHELVLSLAAEAACTELVGPPLPSSAHVLPVSAAAPAHRMAYRDGPVAPPDGAPRWWMHRRPAGTSGASRGSRSILSDRETRHGNVLLLRPSKRCA